MFWEKKTNPFKLNQDRFNPSQMLRQYEPWFFLSKGHDVNHQLIYIDQIYSSN